MPRFMVPRFLDMWRPAQDPDRQGAQALLREAGITATAFDREQA
jgi:hypothetical protein